MTYYPVFMNLKDKPVLVVGAGHVAVGKIRPLLEAGAKVTVVAPWVHPDIPQDHPKLHLVQRSFEDEDLEHKFLVIAATDQPEVNHHIHELGEAKNMLVNVVDDTPYCNFILPSITRQGPLAIAVSSSGTSPTLARKLRQRITEEILEPWLGDFAIFLGAWRAPINPHLPTFEMKKAFWQRVMSSRVPQLVRESRFQGAKALLQTLLDEVRRASGLAPVVLELIHPNLPDDASAVWKSDLVSPRRSA